MDPVALPATDSTVAALRERLAADLDYHLDFQTYEAAAHFLRHCDCLIQGIRRECTETKQGTTKQENISDFLARAHVHLQPLREFVGRASGATVVHTEGCERHLTQREADEEHQHGEEEAAEASGGRQS